MPFVQISLAALILSPTSPASLGQAAAAPKEKSLYKQIVKNPTGKNGYEDYLIAADLVAVGGFKKYDAWAYFLQAETRGLTVAVGKTGEPEPLPEMPPGIIRQSSILDVKREAARRFAKVVELVREGNTKSVSDPRIEIGWETPYPEFSPLKDVARLLIWTAFCRYADGSPTAGTDVLMTSLEFSENIRGSSLISDLVGIACSAMVFAAFENHLGAISERDALRIANGAKGLLVRPPSFARSLKRESGLSERMASRALDPAHTDQLYLMFGEGDVVDAAKRVLDRLTAAQRADLVRRVADELSQRYQAMVRRFEGPESGWLAEAPIGDPEGPEIEIKSADDLAERFVDAIVPAREYSFQAAAKYRTQLRLLRLYGLVLGYKWKNGFFPTALADAVPKDELIDPFSKQEFRYQILPGNVVRIYSTGFAKTGEIELRYRFPKRDDIDPTNPPPK